jgi:large subunit ribosomal protein L32e
MHDSHKKSSLKKRWRRPKGLHNKVRLGKKGYRKKLQKGYGSPKQVKGLHPTGLKPKLVSRVEELKQVEKDEGVIIAAGIGNKRRIEIVNQALKDNIKILNLDPEAFLKKVESEKKKRQEKAKEKEAKAKQKEKEAETRKGVEEKVKKEEELTDEEKKKKEKQEKDKLLTKKT